MVDDLADHYLAFTGRYPTREERYRFENNPDVSFRNLLFRLSWRPGFKESPAYRVHGPHYEKQVEYFGIGVESYVAQWAIAQGIIDNLDRVAFAQCLLRTLEVFGDQLVVGSPG